jgi:hypothetical protein
VKRTYEKTKRIYDLHGASDKCELVVFPGGHNDLPELQTAAFAFFNRHLKQIETPIENVNQKWFTPEELRVFGEKLPEDSINAQVQEVFVPAAEPWKLPPNQEEWEKWAGPSVANCQPSVGWKYHRSIQQLGAVKIGEELILEFVLKSENHFELPMFIRPENDDESRVIELFLLPDAEWLQQDGKFVPQLRGNAKHKQIYLSPRGIGPTATNRDAKKFVHMQRRFQLLGQSWRGEQLVDVVHAVQKILQSPEHQKNKLRLHAQGTLAGLAAYAAHYAPIDELHLTNLPPSNRQGPYFWNVDHHWDMPQAVAKAAQFTKITLHQANPEDWQYPLAVQKKLGWPQKNLVILPK